MIVGQAATVLLASQRVEARALEQRLFEFDFPTLDAALEDLVGGASVTISPPRSRPEGAGEARYELQTRTVVHAPIEETFAFFSKAANLGLITPATMAFSILGQVPPMAQGARIDYHVRVGRAARSMALAHHHVGARPTFCRSPGGRSVPPLVARTFV